MTDYDGDITLSNKFPNTKLDVSMTDDKMTNSNRLTDLVGRLRRWNNPDCKEAADTIEELVATLHRISLCSQNSMSSKEECGRIARAAREGKDD